MSRARLTAGASSTASGVLGLSLLASAVHGRLLAAGAGSFLSSNLVNVLQLGMEDPEQI